MKAQPELIPMSETFRPPTLDDCLKHAEEIGLPETQAKLFHSYYESNGWKVGKNKMKLWKAAMAGWKIRHEERSGGQRVAPQVHPTAQLRAIESLINNHPANPQSAKYAGKGNVTDQQKVDLKALRNRREEIESQIARSGR